MRHRKKTIKLGRTSEHRAALLSSLVCNLIARKRIVTTVPKAKAARSYAEKMVTLGKRGTLASRRQALSKLRKVDAVSELFTAVAPAFKDRQGGYTRIMRLQKRASDSSEMAILEWVNYIPVAPKKKKPAKDDKPGKDEKPAKDTKATEKKQKAEKSESEKKAAK